MRNSSMKFFVAIASLCLVPQVMAAGTGSPAPAPAAGGNAPEVVRDPIAEAQRLYDQGVRLVAKAEKAGADERKVRKDYLAALKKFESAVERNPQLAEGWNYVGYCRRKSGDAGGALGAYDEALRLKPGFAEALEYRGHAFLGMGRVDDARRDYLDLFGRNRALAAQLLAGIKTWAAAQRTAGGDDATLSRLDAWVAEREQLAAQTAALSREGSAAGWN